MNGAGRWWSYLVCMGLRKRGNNEPARFRRGEDENLQSPAHSRVIGSELGVESWAQLRGERDVVAKCQRNLQIGIRERGRA